MDVWGGLGHQKCNKKREKVEQEREDKKKVNMRPYERPR